LPHPVYFEKIDSEETCNEKKTLQKCTLGEHYCLRLCASVADCGCARGAFNCAGTCWHLAGDVFISQQAPARLNTPQISCFCRFRSSRTRNCGACL